MYNMILFDQGTEERYLITKKYNISNSFFMNHNGYSLSFNVLFSYLYTKYIFLLEEDWQVKNNIEMNIFHPSFLQESMLILSSYKYIYGVLLRELKDMDVNYSVSVKTELGKHLLFILKNVKSRYSFTNGACVYRSSDLLKVKIYTSEYLVSSFFKERNYKLGFTYKGIRGRKNSTNIQSVMRHIGGKSTKYGLCNLSLY